MKKRYIILYIFVFLIVGELIVRIDKKYLVLDNDPVKIDIKIEETVIKKQVDNASFVLKSNQIRILVVGDSYIHGGGIDPKFKFSKKINQILQASNKIEREVIVLDISRPSNNTMDNYNSLLHYQTRFKPHFIFWAYNFNDIIGGVQFKPVNETEKVIYNEPPKRLPKKRKGLNGFVKTFYSTSELTRLLSTNIQKELKLKGLVLPFGDFYYLTKQAYLDSNLDWIETKKILTDVSKETDLNHTQLILYNLPEFNLLDEEGLFTQIDNSFENFANTTNNIIYLNGRDDFPKENSDQFLISKYDGHPNALAHKVIAERIAKIIEEQVSIK